MTEKLNYAVECSKLDFGLLNARNQLITKAINPLLDMILAAVKKDRIVDSGTEYTLTVVVTSTRDTESVSIQ